MSIIQNKNKKTMKIKIGTQNLRILTAKESINPFSNRFWIKRMKRIANNIKSVDLDLIAVQESIGRLQMYVLRYFLGWRKYRFISVRQGLTPSRVGIMYKREFELVDRANVLLSKAESFKEHARYGIYANFLKNHVFISFASVHLSHYSIAAFNEGLSQLEYLSYTVEHMVIAGDFNKESFNHMLWQAADDEIDKTYISFDEKHKGKKIDYIFTPQWVERGQTQTIGDNLASDHLLVWTEIII